MELSTVHNILLLSLFKAFDGHTDVYVMLDQIESAVCQVEREADPPIRRISSQTASVIIALDDKKYVQTNRGRVFLKNAGAQACQGLELPAGWSALPQVLKKMVRRSA